MEKLKQNLADAERKDGSLEYEQMRERRATADIKELELTALLASPPEIGISDWAGSNLVLRKGASSRPGPWRTESCQRGILDALGNPQVRQIAFRKSTWVGWSAMLRSAICLIESGDQTWDLDRCRR